MASTSEKIAFLATGALLGATCYMAWKHPDKLKELTSKALAMTSPPPTEGELKSTENTQIQEEK